MNGLEQWLFDEWVGEEEAMDSLQKNGIVSDNCVSAADVADADIDRAIEFLKSYPI